MSPRKVDKRPELLISHDSDNGVTLRDPLSGVVLSIISTHPLANGPKGLIVEAYSIESGRQMLAQKHEPRLAPNPAHPVVTFYALPERKAE